MQRTDVLHRCADSTDTLHWFLTPACCTQGAPEREEEDVYSMLYPPLRATLLCLSKLYRAVDGSIFSGLAQEAVSACTVSVQQASTMLARKVMSVSLLVVLIAP